MKKTIEKIFKNRREKPDPTPVTIPIKFRRSESADERMRRIIAHSISAEAAKMDLESFEEADDFDIPDDPIDPTTPWEEDFDLSTAQAVEHGLVKKPTSKKSLEQWQKDLQNKKSPPSDSEPPPSDPE